MTFLWQSCDLIDEVAQLARTKLVSHGLAPSGNYGISSSIKVHSGAAYVGESSPSPIKLMWTYRDLNDGSVLGLEGLQERHTGRVAPSDTEILSGYSN